jgi:hypothetical protein
MGFTFPHGAATQNRWVLPSRTVREHFSHGFFLPARCGDPKPMGFTFPHRAATQNRWVLPSRTVRRPKTDGFWLGAPISTILTTKYFYYEKKVIGTSF